MKMEISSFLQLTQHIKNIDCMSTNRKFYIHGALGVRGICYQKTGKIFYPTHCVENNCIRTLPALGAFPEWKTAGRLTLSSLFDIKLANGNPLTCSLDSEFHGNHSKYNKTPCTALNFTCLAEYISWGNRSRVSYFKGFSEVNNKHDLAD